MLTEHKFSSFYRCPKYAQEIFDGLRLNPEKSAATFCDRYGRWVQAPLNNKDREYCPTGYAIAMWDFKDESILIGEDNETLYVRNIDTVENGSRRLNSWHAIGSIEAEYKVSGGDAYTEWNTLFKIETRKLPVRIHRAANGKCKLVPQKEEPLKSVDMLLQWEERSSQPPQDILEAPFNNMFYASERVLVENNILSDNDER